MFFGWLICWHAPLNMRLVDSENNGKTDRIPRLSAPRAPAHPSTMPYLLSISFMGKGGGDTNMGNDGEKRRLWLASERASSKHTEGRDDSQSRFHVPLKEKDRESPSHVGQVTRCDCHGNFT